MSTGKNCKIIDDKNSCGFIYPFIDKIINLLKFINLVELFKYLSKKILAENASERNIISNSRIAVDIFIIGKWLYLIWLIFFQVNSTFHLFFVWYLIYSNVYTYFYYHTWSDLILSDNLITASRLKRRFVNLCISILFTIFCFAYLYFVPYRYDYKWINTPPTFFSSLVFSISNSLTANFNEIVPQTKTGTTIAIIQLVIMAIFITIIIVGSIPQINCIERDGKNGVQK